jgi:hypothetical protein
VFLLAGIFKLDGGPEFGIDSGNGVVFGKHGVLQSRVTDSKWCYLAEGQSEYSGGMTGSLNLLTILAAQAHGY